MNKENTNKNRTQTYRHLKAHPQHFLIVKRSSHFDLQLDIFLQRYLHTKIHNAESWLIFFLPKIDIFVYIWNSYQLSLFILSRTALDTRLDLVVTSVASTYRYAQINHV